MSRKLLVTGAGGFVAGSVIVQGCERLGEEWELHAMSRRAILAKLPRLTWHLHNPVDKAGLRQLFDAVRPDAVIHTAAIADIDFCQRNQEIAHHANVEITRDLARLCGERGIRLIFSSTDNVFDGTRGKYREDDAPSPVNFYGETKVEAERAVAQYAADSVVARICIVMGFGMIGEGNAFLPRMIKSLREGQRVGVPDEETRTPIDAITLGRALLELATDDDTRKFSGTLHLAGNEALRRFNMAQRIAARLGFSGDLIFVQNPSSSSDRAPRPLDVSLDNAAARALLKTPMVGLDEGLKLVLASQAEIKAPL